MTKSKIPWTEQTWNPVIGCTKVSDGCKFCYAEKRAVRLANILHPSTSNYKFGGILTDFVSDKKAGWSGKVKCIKAALDIPLKRKKPTMYFVCSMGDLFHKNVPFDFIDRIASVIDKCPQHTFQILTKRPEIALKYSKYSYKRLKKFKPRIRPNVWLGTSCENQKTADERIPYLLQTPSAVRFLSLEPLLGKINFHATNVHLQSEHNCDTDIDQVIIGCESKGGWAGRPCKLEWVRDIVSQCKATGIPVFVKQLNIGGKLIKKVEEFPKDLRLRQMPESR